MELIRKHYFQNNLRILSSTFSILSNFLVKFLERSAAASHNHLGAEGLAALELLILKICSSAYSGYYCHFFPRKYAFLYLLWLLFNAIKFVFSSILKETSLSISYICYCTSVKINLNICGVKTSKCVFKCKNKYWLTEPNFAKISPLRFPELKVWSLINSLDLLFCLFNLGTFFINVFFKLRHKTLLLSRSL